MSNIVQLEIHQKNRWIYFTRYRWIAHVIYWGWVFVAGTLMTVKVPLTPAVIFNNFILENLLIAVFYYIYCLYLIPYYFKKNKNPQFWVLTVGSYLLITALDTWLAPIVVTYYTDHPMAHETSFWARYSYNLGGFLLNFMVFSMMLFFMEKNEESRRLLELENEKKEIEEVKLNLLKTNISPDFLMRSLKQLKESAAHGDEHTPESILTFSDLLRYRLYWVRQQFSPLKEELQALHQFIHFISMNQFRHSLEISLTEEGTAAAHQIAPLSLINILELFCKVQSSRAIPLDMHLSITATQLNLRMEYHEHAPASLVKDLEDYGSNYQQLFGDSIRFQFENCEDSRCRIRLSLPLH